MIPAVFTMSDHQQQQQLEHLKKLRELEAQHARRRGGWAPSQMPLTDIDSLILETASAFSLPVHRQIKTTPLSQQQQQQQQQASPFHISLQTSLATASPANCFSFFKPTKVSPAVDQANLMSFLHQSTTTNAVTSSSRSPTLEMLLRQRQQQEQQAATMAALTSLQQSAWKAPAPLQSRSSSVGSNSNSSTTSSVSVEAPINVKNSNNIATSDRKSINSPINVASLATEEHRQDSYEALRRATFGTRHELPLQMTGEGVLDRNEINALNTGFLMLLPADAEGRSVLSIDMSRIDGCSKASIQRCLFYMFSVMAQEDSRAVLLYRKVSPMHEGLNTWESDEKSAEKFIAICTAVEKYLNKLLRVMPLKLDRIHLFGTTDIPPQFAHLTPRVVVHPTDNDDDNDTDEKALQNQFSLTVWPKYCPGGEWGYAQFFEWQELRTRMEWRVPVGLCGKSAESGRFPAIHAYEVQRDTTAGERKRRLNVIHSRRKRSRDRIEQELVYDQVVELQQAQKKLRQTQQRLELCLSQAHECIRRLPKAN